MVSTEKAHHHRTVRTLGKFCITPVLIYLQSVWEIFHLDRIQGIVDIVPDVIYLMVLLQK